METHEISYIFGKSASANIIKYMDESFEERIHLIQD